MFMDIRHIRSGSVSLAESRLLRFSLAPTPTPEFKRDIPDVKIDVGSADKPITNVEDVKPVTDKLITDASSAVRGAGEKIAGLTEKGLKFGQEQLGKFNEFMASLKLPAKPAAETDANADKQASADEKPVAEKLAAKPDVAKHDEEQPVAEQKADISAESKRADIADADGQEAPLKGNGIPEGVMFKPDLKNKTATLRLGKSTAVVDINDVGQVAPDALDAAIKTLVSAEKGAEKPVVEQADEQSADAQSEGKEVPVKGLFVDISAADGKEIPLVANGLPEGLVMKADVKNKTLTLRLGNSTETLVINDNGQIDPESIGEAVNKLKVAEGGKEKDGKAPEVKEKQPETYRQLLQQQIDDANAILRSPESKGVDKLMAGIQALGALKQMMDRAFKGTLDEPLGKKEDPAAATKDGAKEKGADKNGSKDKDSEKGGGKEVDNEKGGAEGDRDANPETDEKREQPSKNRRERLRDEMKEKKGGHKELLEDKREQVEKSKDKIKAIDEKIDGLEERHDTLDDEQDADRTKLRNLEQELRGADEDDKGDLEEQVADLKEDMEMRDDEMKVLDKNRQKLLDRKERKQPKALEKDVKELEAMRADREAEIKTLNETIQTIADALRSAPDATPDMLAFAKILDDEEHTLDEKTLQGVASAEADAAVIDFAKSMDYELPKGWEKNMTAFAEAMEGLAKAVLEKSSKKESGEGADRTATPSEESSDGGAETAANHLREVADAQSKTDAAIKANEDLIIKESNGEEVSAADKRAALTAVIDAITTEQGVIKHDAEQIPLDQAQRLQEISALLPQYEKDLADLDAASKKKEESKDEAPDLNKEDAEKFSKWAKAIEDKSNELGYAVTVTAGKDGSMTIAHKGDFDETAQKTLDTLKSFASGRGMAPVENEDHSLSINVQINDKDKGYFGQVNEEFVQQFELKAGDALDTAGKEKAVAEDKPAVRGTPKATQVDGDGSSAAGIA